jgi:hypothetical protein
MKLQHEQQPNPDKQNALIRHESTNISTFAELAKNRIMSKHGMIEQEWIVYDAAVSIGLLTLRTAFPTQARNYNDREHDMLIALWLEIFAETAPDIFHEAIMRFVATDRKGFFPSPGQVMGFAEDIIKEREWKETEAQLERHAEYLRAIQKRIDNGENCSTCRFCECREKTDIWDSRKKETGLFCQNPESYKYEGDYGWGTAASIICEHYEPKTENNESEVEIND